MESLLFLFDHLLRNRCRIYLRQRSNMVFMNRADVGKERHREHHSKRAVRGDIAHGK